jgi:hypothetical protein
VSCTEKQWAGAGLETAPPCVPARMVQQGHCWQQLGGTQHKAITCRDAWFPCTLP